MLSGRPASSFLVLLTLVFLAVSPGLAGQPMLRMATTTSTDNTGLLDYLAPMFTRDTGIKLEWVAVGTGRALALGRNCDVSVLLVHAPAAEQKFVKAGYGVARREVMYNDFIIIGPPEDPAGIKGGSAKIGLRKITAGKNIFVSRGDDSGTYKKELSIWKAAMLPVPDREDWYIQTGQGMLASTRIAAERKGYVLLDRGTYIKYQTSLPGKVPLVILVQGDRVLVNQYSAIAVNPANCPDAKYKPALEFIRWLENPSAQKAIADFRLNGFQLFKPGSAGGK